MWLWGRACNAEVTGVTLPGMEATSEEGPWVQPAVEASDAWPWLSKVEESIAEAKEHEGPLDGRKMLADIQKLIVEVRGRAWDLQYTRMRADKADNAEREVKRLGSLCEVSLKNLNETRDRVGKANDEAAAISVRLGTAKSKIEVLEIGERGHQHQLGLYQKRVNEADADIERLTKELAEAKDGQNEWLIWESGMWWRALGGGTTLARSEAHHYTWLETRKYAPSETDGGKVCHVSDMGWPTSEKSQP